jgi:hypothetical protein
MLHDVVFAQQLTVTSYSEKKSPVFSGGFKEPADPSTEIDVQNGTTALATTT